MEQKQWSGIAIGEEDFKMLREENCYYIDKSLFIKDIIDNKSKVVLITRPRRFGKTLNMSMLRYYFDLKLQNTKPLFEKLKIMEQGEEYVSKQGAYPVIYMTLKDVKAENYEEMINRFKHIVTSVYKQYMELLESNKIYDFEKKKINNILYERSSITDTKNSILDLSECLNREYNKPVILLIDEHDVPLQEAYIQGFYEEAVRFFKDFFVTTFKTNSYLLKTVLTGVSRIAKESLFSGANNFTVCTILDNEFADDFGITEQEMEKIIKDFEIENNKEEIKNWYDGYTIGDVEGIYNPWSIINYLNKRILQAYWVNTSSNDLIKLILKNSYTIKEQIEKLLKGEAIDVTVNLETVITGIENDENNIWGLMLGTGYLKVVQIVDVAEKRYKVSLPNREIKELFREIVRDWFLNKVPGNDLRSLLKDLVELKLDEFEMKFEVLVKEMFSYFDVGENTAENFYHAYVLGMLVGLKDTYYVNSNRESGFGRYDIMLEPKDKNGNSFIMEFKVYNDKKTEEQAIGEAIKQIEEKCYEESLKEKGFSNITKMVFAFNKKNVKMKIIN